jgi:putative intracellular protease/amidase
VNSIQDAAAAPPRSSTACDSTGRHGRGRKRESEAGFDAGAFNLYTVAPRPQPVPLTGGLDLVPDLTFGQLDSRLAAGPEVIVVPQLHDAGEPSAAPIIEWLRRQRAQGDPLLLSMCVGAEVLASAGVLDGRPATSHWLGLIGLRRDYPAVRWQEGVRYVDDGDVITTAGVLSGVDGALRVVERMVGQPAAEQAARALHWPSYSPSAFDAALRDIARTRDVATARWVAKTLQYPTTNPRLDGPAWPWALTLRPILLVGAAVAAALGIRFLRHRQESCAGSPLFAAGRLVRHYLEMVLAMVAGMVVLGRAESVLLDPFGWAGLRGQPEIHTLVMATNMTVAMVAWMRLRGHG